MKRIFIGTVCLCCFFLLCTWAAATDFVDDFSGAVTAHTQDDTLTPSLYGHSLEPSDRMQLVVGPNRSGRHIGMVGYQIAGVQQITLRIYSPKGTYVSSDALGMPALGTDSGVFSPEINTVTSAYYNPQDGNLYTYMSGWYMLVQSPNGDYSEFVSAPSPDARNLLHYGVNAYISSGGGQQRLPLARTAIRHVDIDGTLFCAEDFTCPVPGGSTQVLVELNDISGTLLSRKGAKTSLAWVMLTGNSLVLGGQPPAGEESSHPQESSRPSSSRESARPSQPSTPPPSDAPSAAPPAGSGASIASSKPQEASSKFEGTITTSSKSSKSASSTSSASPGPAQQSAIPLAAEQHPAEQPLVYEVKTTPSGSNGPDWGMILYILAISAIILILLLRPKSGRK